MAVTSILEDVRGLLEKGTFHSQQPKTISEICFALAKQSLYGQKP